MNRRKKLKSKHQIVRFVTLVVEEVTESMDVTDLLLSLAACTVSTVMIRLIAHVVPMLYYEITHTFSSAQAFVLCNFIVVLVILMGLGDDGSSDAEGTSREDSDTVSYISDDEDDHNSFELSDDGYDEEEDDDIDDDYDYTSEEEDGDGAGELDREVEEFIGEIYNRWGRDWLGEMRPF